MSTDSLGRIGEVCRPGSHLGLERLTELLRRMGDPQDQLRYVHVAGSNGKGSVCAMLSAVLSRAGYRTGMYTSPQLVRLNERYRIDGREISDDALISLTEQVRSVAMEMEDRPTEFEITTAMMFRYFLEQRCDIVVLEVGLGGRLDATNVIPAPEAAVIGHIGLEHTRELGDTLEKIAYEKAGIIKSGCTAVTYPSDQGVETVLETVCREHNVRRRPVDLSRLQILESGLDGQRIHMEPWGELFLPLRGDHQAKNAALALETLEALRSRGWSIPREAAAEALARVEWPARLELLRREPLFLLDGAHNPQCMESLAGSLRRLLPDGRAVILMGVMADKEYEKMTELLRPFARRFVCVTPRNDRALPAPALAAFLRSRGFEAESCPTVAHGVRRGLELAGQGALVACGSLYMAGDIRAAAADLL